MQLEESSIFVRLKRLRVMLYQMQFHMTKTDRVIYGTPIMNSCGEALGAFVLAFMSIETKQKYMDMSISWFTRLRVDLEFCAQENILKFRKRVPKSDEDPNNPRNEVNSQKVELFKLVAEIDRDMCKWKASTKGKTLRE